MSTYDTTIAYTKNENFNSGGTGGFTANTGTVSNPTGNQLHMTANWASKPLATTSVYLVNGRSYTLNLDIVGFSVVSGFSHTVRVRVVLPGAAFNTDFTTTGTKTITFTSNTTGYVNIEIRSIISPPTGVYSGKPYIDIDNFKVSWDSAFTSSDTICVSKSGYRYGFNGMEKVDEISGEGNGYDFGARMYDGRLGVFLSQDKYYFDYPDFSPYCFAINSPLLHLDPDGNKIKIFYQVTVNGKTKTKKVTLKDMSQASIGIAILLSGGNQYVMDVIKSLQYVEEADNSVGGGIIKKLAESKRTIRIKKAENGNDFYNPFTNTVKWDNTTGFTIKDIGTSAEAGNQSPAMALYHELAHGYREIFEKIKFILSVLRSYSKKSKDAMYDNKEEKAVIDNYETPVAKYLNEPTRNNHRIIGFVKVLDPTDHINKK